MFIPFFSVPPTPRKPRPRDVRALVAALVIGAIPAGAQPPKAGSTGEPWRLVQPPQSTLVLARDGSLIGEIGREWRTSVSIRTLPAYVYQAFVAVEDQRFYQHHGVDLVGIAGALKDNILGSRRGASTITQQLVGNMHPDVIDRRDQSPSRKLREQQAALEMERHYSKEQILEGYLNQISFGHNWYGIESAARHYFGKSAAQLTLAEAASLASLPKGPAIYDPAAHPAKNRERRNTVLALMAQQKYITAAQAAAASREPIVTAPNAGMSVWAPYFVDAVRSEVERAGVPVANGGYRIVTPIDPALQRAAADALTAGTLDVEKRPGYHHPTKAVHAKGEIDYVQGAVVALDPGTGEVRALVGGRDYLESPFDRAVNGLRQPGSSFKPIVYATALSDTTTAASIVYDTALAIPMGNGTTYRPENADGQFLGPLTLREALTKSRNPVAVQLWLAEGADSVIAHARRMGIESAIAPYPSSAIGASVVRPIELVGAFTAFANTGVSVRPRLVMRVEDRAGKVVWTPRGSAPQFAFDPRVAFIVRDMMRDVVERGTATSVRRWLPPRVPVAGKTGTTNDNTDVWFVGMTPELVAGVWLGFDKPRTIAPGAVGGTLAAPIWGRMMAQYYASRPTGAWTPPPGLVTAELDRATGQLATAATPAERRYTEYFIDGTEPGAIPFDPMAAFRWGPVP